MTKEVSLHDNDLNNFISGERGKVLSYLRKKYTLSDDDLNDIFQDASMALFLNVRNGKLTNLTSSLGTYFMRVCINHTLKFLGKHTKSIPVWIGCCCIMRQSSSMTATPLAPSLAASTGFL